MFVALEHARTLIAAGRRLVVAGDEALLRQLPRGTWIGGTIPYFMTSAGGVTSRDGLFVEEVPTGAIDARTATYDGESIARIGTDSPERGYSIVIIPAFTALHRTYALEAPSYPGLFFKVIAGWIAGVRVDEIGRRAPLVFDGQSGEALDDRAAALHVTLPPGERAELGIINIFQPGDGDVIEFPMGGFTVTDAIVNGRRTSFARYVAERGLDTQLPLVADFNGVLVNVSIQRLDAATGETRFYAPVFEGVRYRLAGPVDNYPQRFAAAIEAAGVDRPAFACNCVLNYLYGGLEGRRTGALIGPMTFGEIAYQLVNQTLVHVTVRRD